MEEETVQLQEIQSNEPVTVCDIHFRTGTKTYYFDPNGLELKPGDHVIIETSRGPEFGYCSAGAHTVSGSVVVQPLRKVLRLATNQDEYLNDDNRRLEKSAYAFCQERIERLGLEMQLVRCEYAFDGSKIMFYFTADGRVDFRELVRQLASNFHTRVELRQIGVRDKAKMVGGLGICGRPFCCGQFLSDFAPVSIKMAKTQSLSLNPTKISGTCGRLMCCLKYEQEAYEDLLKTSPKEESFVDTPDGRGTVISVDLMRQSVKVRLEKDPEELRSFRNEEIAVFRNGKAKKTDLPIPDDWAPISGNRPVQKAEEYPRFERPVEKPVEEPMLPEPVLIQAVPVVAVPVETTENPVQTEQKKSRRRNNKNRRKPGEKPVAKEPAPAKEKPAQKEKPLQKEKPPAKEKPAGKPNTKQNKPQKEAAEAAVKPEKAEKVHPEKPKREKRRKPNHPQPAQEAAAKPAAAANPEAPAEGQQKKKKRRFYHPKKQS